MKGRPPNLKTLQTPTDETLRIPLQIPPCPETLAGAAVEEWLRITELLAGLGLIGQLDRAALAIYCQAWMRWTDAEQSISQQGTIVKSPNGYPIQNPYVAISRHAAKQMQSLLSQFGLSPAARHRLLRGNGESGLASRTDKQK